MQKRGLTNFLQHIPLPIIGHRQTVQQLALRFHQKFVPLCGSVCGRTQQQIPRLRKYPDVSRHYMSSSFYKSVFIKMNQLFVSFSILAFISCNSNTPDQNKAVNTTPIDLRITDNMDILGNWSMCSTSSNGSMIQYNVCPTVAFRFDGTGSANTENFSWSFKKGNLNILYANKDSNITFPDTTYFGTINKQDNIMNLTIQQLKGDSKYYLSK